MENHAGRFETPSVNLGLFSGETVQQNAERQTTRMDDTRPLQDARGHRSHVQPTGLDESQNKRRQPGAINTTWNGTRC